METEKKIASPRDIKGSINNQFYEDLHEAWYEQDDHPIALLRAENNIRNPWIIQTIHQNKSGSCQILDVGCGAGLLSNALAQHDHEVTGIDLSASSLAQAKLKDLTHRVKYVCASAEILPFTNQSFDVVCAMDFLEHIENPQQMIREISRVLKPQGLFFFHTFNRNFWSYLIAIKCVEWFMPNVPKNMHVYSLFIKPQELDIYCGIVKLKIGAIQGLMPDFKSIAFWKSFIQRKITPDFRFSFTSSTQIGYIGFYTQDTGALLT